MRLEQIGHILQTTVSSALSLMKMFEFPLEFSKIVSKHQLFQGLAWYQPEANKLPQTMSAKIGDAAWRYEAMISFT